MSEEIPIMHLAVDVQWTFYRHLKEDRATSFQQKVQAFADALHDDFIPTTWIGMLRFSKGLQGFHRPAYFNPEQREALSFYDTKMHTSDYVFVKNTLSAFQNGMLAWGLDKLKTHTVVITGLHTKQCIAETVVGAAEAHKTVFVATDLLADLNAGGHDADPAWHARAIQEEVNALIEEKGIPDTEKLALRSRINYTTSEAYLATLRPKDVARLAPESLSVRSALGD